MALNCSKRNKRIRIKILEPRFKGTLKPNLHNIHVRNEIISSIDIHLVSIKRLNPLKDSVVDGETLRVTPPIATQTKLQ